MNNSGVAVVELLCHLVGDYVLQNHWMATNKVRVWLPAIVHAAVYSLVFLLWLQPSWPAMAVIFGTHLIIDRYRLAKYWVEWYGIGCESWLQRNSRILKPKNLVKAPDYLSVWLLIIVDNTFHLLINYFSVRYL